MNIFERFKRLTVWNKLGSIGALASIIGVMIALFMENSSTPTSSISGVSHTGTGSIFIGINNDSNFIVNRSSGSRGGILFNRDEIARVRGVATDLIAASGDCVVAITDGITTTGHAISKHDYYSFSNVGGIQTISRIPGRSRRDFGLPALDIKLVNNCKDTVFVTELQFSNITSKTDPQPEIDVSGANFATGNNYITVKNHGWGSARNLVLAGTMSFEHIRSKHLPAEPVAL